MNIDLSGKVVLVTGGSRGIGAAVVEAFANAGATVLFTYAGATAHANALVEKLQAKGKTVEAVQANAADFELAQTVVNTLVEKYARIDVVINNAGITRDNLLLRMTEAQWDEVLANNLKSVFNYTKAAARFMLKQKSGCFINIGSVVGIDGQAGQANYAASKAGIMAFTRTTAKELGSRNIRANVIAPGFIETDMTAALPTAETEKWLQGIPLGRAGKANEVADLCLFLASDYAGYITGQVLCIDGGML